jgi:hypothetical protein
MKIENIYVCPKCTFATPGPVKPKFCRECGYSYIENNFDTFTTPITITEQLVKLEDLEGARDAIMLLTHDKAASIMEDAKKIIETIGGRKARAVDIRPIVDRAIEIGEIAKAYDAFIRAGGKHAPSLYINNNDDQEIEDEPTDKPSPPGNAQPMLEHDSERDRSVD